MPVSIAHIAILSALSGNIPGSDPAWGVVRSLDEDSDEAKRLREQVELGLCLHLTLSR